MTLDLAHLHPDYREAAQLPDDSRLTWLKTERWIAFPKAMAVLDRLTYLLEYPTRPRMPCLLVYGRSGMGKSMALERFKKSHPAAFNKAEGTTVRPVVVFQLPKEPDEERFWDQLLKGMEIELRQPLSKKDGERLSIRLLREARTRLLIMDELNFILAGTARQQRAFLNLIRFLTNELAIPVVCAGTPDAHQALLSDQHLADRFDAMELTPWRDDESFVLLMRTLASTRPLRQRSDLESAPVRKRLIQLSEGVTGRIFRLIEEAAIAAIRSGREMMDIDTFANDALVPPLASMKRAVAKRGNGLGN